MTIYIGIDPGQTGAVAWIDTKNQSVDVVDCPMNGTELDIAGCLHVFSQFKGKSAKAVIEFVNGRNMGCMGAFKFGGNWYTWKTSLIANNINYTSLDPKKWKPMIGLPLGVGKSQSKIDSRKLAAQLFPSLKSKLSRVKDHGRSDALLMAECCRQLYA